MGSPNASGASAIGSAVIRDHLLLDCPPSFCRGQDGSSFEELHLLREEGARVISCVDGGGGGAACVDGGERGGVIPISLMVVTL